MKNVSQFLTRVNRRNLTNNTQRVLLRLLAADGEWVSAGQLRQVVRSNSTSVDATTARVRDLRKAAFGGFDVQCASAAELNRDGGSRRFFYRLNISGLTTQQVARVLTTR